MSKLMRHSFVAGAFAFAACGASAAPTSCQISHGKAGRFVYIFNTIGHVVAQGGKPLEDPRDLMTRLVAAGDQRTRLAISPLVMTARAELGDMVHLRGASVVVNAADCQVVKPAPNGEVRVLATLPLRGGPKIASQ